MQIGESLEHSNKHGPPMHTISAGGHQDQMNSTRGNKGESGGAQVIHIWDEATQGSLWL